jgi:hypothetical protein
MHRFIVVSLMITVILSAEVNGQEYFNRRYNIPNQWLYDYSTTVLSENGSYITGGETGSPTNPILGRIAVSILNANGDLLSTKYFGQAGIEYGIGYPGSLIKTISDGYWVVGYKRSPYPGWVRDQGLLLRLNDNCDSLWTKLYGDIIEPCDTELLIRQIHQLNDGKVVMLGGLMDLNVQHTYFYLVQTDSTGNRIWEHFYGQLPYWYFPYSFACTSDKGFIIGGEQSLNEYQSHDPILIKTDSLGHEEWFLNIGSEFFDSGAIVDTSSDGDIIVGAPIADSAPYYDDAYRRINVIKLKNAGSVVWNRKYGRSNLANKIWSIKSLPDGRIILTGSRKTDHPARPDILSWILCTNSDGDSLWYREYSLLNAEYSRNFLWDVSATDDQGFIACGYVYPVSPDTGTQDTWIIKVDSLGCESPTNCWVGINELHENSSFYSGSIKVYPNPAKEVVNFEFSEAIKKEETEITITNLMGITIYKMQIIDPRAYFELDISSWPTGMYVARIVFMNDVVAVTKFVKD